VFRSGLNWFSSCLTIRGAEAEDQEEGNGGDECVEGASSSNEQSASMPMVQWYIMRRDEAETRRRGERRWDE